MKFNVLVEKILTTLQPTSDRAVFVFGRMNPPTLGHELLMAKAVEIGRKEKRDCYIFLSQTQDAKKNPLTFSDKIKALDAALPHVNFINSANVKTIFDAVNFLIENGYKDLVLVCGSDRSQEFENLFQKYINTTDVTKKLNLTNFRTAVAGAERDPDSDEASGISATKARNLAKAGDYEAFRGILPTGMPDANAKDIFNKIRKNLK